MASKDELGPIANFLFDVVGLVVGLVSIAPWIIGVAFVLFLIVKVIKLFWYA